MEYRAVIKKSENWRIGWLIDLPGVKAQEKSRVKLIESLKIGAEDMLNTPVEPKDEEELVKIKVLTNPATKHLIWVILTSMIFLTKQHGTPFG